MANPIKKAFLTMLGLIGLVMVVQSQKPEPVRSDSSKLWNAFKGGKVSGLIRYYFSATDNHSPYTDYFANALGGAIKYETGNFHGFRAGIEVYSNFNLGSSDLSKPDSISRQLDRYELGLFDVENPANKRDITRLTELYLSYTISKTTLKLGRQALQTPFLNVQDGRMQPSVAQGIVFETQNLGKMKIEGGWIIGISPRSSSRWFSTAGSVGVYSMGVTTSGKKANYYGAISSKGVFFLGTQCSPIPWFKWTVHDLFFENVMNTVLVQIDLNWAIKPNWKIIGGAQSIRQDAVGNGGNPNPENTYINPKASAITLGGRLGFEWKGLEFTTNYNRIFNNGRFLMPREWGREPFYTFIPRERNEGAGNVHAWVAKLQYGWEKTGIKIGLAGGYYQFPDAKDFRLNKYGMPSYAQLNLDIKYRFTKWLKGLDAQLLVAGKINRANMYGEAKYEINKVNLVLYNFILNYLF
ncbi:MAG: OprD family outer membrane porin [Bacteroidia bacterium]|nr:OprD family outer membrane porin [Bacteroidia bacterium]